MALKRVTRVIKRVRLGGETQGVTTVVTLRVAVSQRCVTVISPMDTTSLGEMRGGVCETRGYAKQPTAEIPIAKPRGWFDIATNRRGEHAVTHAVARGQQPTPVSITGVGSPES